MNGVTVQPVAAQAGRKKMIARRTAWAVYAGGAILVLLDPLFSAVAPTLRWLPFVGAALSILVLPVLIGLYWRIIAQWRTLIVLALVGIGLELIQGRLGSAEGHGLAAAASTLTAMLRLEAMATFFIAMVILAIRRDVSVAYIVLAFGLGTWLVFVMVQSAGGVLAFLLGPLSGNPTTGWSVLAPLVANTSCMATLGLLTFIPHFVYVVWKEVNAGKSSH